MRAGDARGYALSLAKDFSMTKVSLLLCGFVFEAAVTAPSGSNHPSVNVIPEQAFDSYWNICWRDEKARLDNFAIQLKEKGSWLV